MSVEAGQARWRNHKQMPWKIVLVLTAIALVCGCDLLSKPRQGDKINERWETSNESFKVRVTAYAEENAGFVGGAYYVFECTPRGSDTWREIMTFRHDDPVPIPREHVRFVNDQIGYVFMVYKYAVTTDGGATWQTWDIVGKLPDWQNNRAAIKDVKIGENGVGVMKLDPFSDRPKVRELFTKDYGRHWSVTSG
jgi:hypothetical protein